MRYALLLTALMASRICLAQPYHISTIDITNFWQAYDALEQATSNTDSLAIIENLYLKRASKGFKKFLKIRDFKAGEYLYHIKNSPGFWRTVRPLTEQIANRQNEIIEVMQRMECEIPNFKVPKICFAIGALRTGGTIADGYILIGSEIAVADNTVDTTNLNGWLKSIIGKTGDIVSMVAHEAVHTNQRGNIQRTVLTASMMEGVADFMTSEILGKNINFSVFEYGLANECLLWKEFELEMNTTNYDKWLYNGTSSRIRPADLGYFIGHRIAQRYYSLATDKRAALTDLLDRSKYLEIFQNSGYQGCTQ